MLAAVRVGFLNFAVPLVYGTSGRLRQRKDFNDLKNLAPNGAAGLRCFLVYYFKDVNSESCSRFSSLRILQTTFDKPSSVMADSLP
jgi:hypothetical protein